MTNRNKGKCCTVILHQRSHLIPKSINSLEFQSIVSLALEKQSAKQNIILWNSSFIVIFLGLFCPKGKGAFLSLCEAPTRETRPDHKHRELQGESTVRALLFSVSAWVL